jgi:hypothetical protein
LQQVLSAWQVQRKRLLPANLVKIGNQQIRQTRKRVLRAAFAHFGIERLRGKCLKMITARAIFAFFATIKFPPLAA